jgi:glucose-1-phosphate thymidylyltransferase
VKGIILAGGTGTRLKPLTNGISKQLLPIYDKPMIYYPLTTLILAGVQEILIITTSHDQQSFKKVLGDGSEFGVNLTYALQEKPNGLSEALIIGEDFLSRESCLLILGDNIFHGEGLGLDLTRNLPAEGSHIFVYEISDPSRYGVLELDSNDLPLRVIEKPSDPVSNLAITGLYFFDGRASKFAKQVKPSNRNELEITSLIEIYLNMKELTYSRLSRGAAWLDTGTFETLHDAGTYVRILEERQGLKIGDPIEASKILKRAQFEH